MKRNILLGAGVALMMGVACTDVQAASVSTDGNLVTKREFRSTWVAGMGIDWPYGSDRSKATAQQQLRDYLDDLKAQNFTGICLHVRPRADAYYKSTLEPWSADLTGVRGKDPGWDPLAFAIEECHKRGMEIYAWVNPYRVNADNVTYTTSFDKQWDKDGWLIRSNGWTSFNPGHPEARKHCLDVMKEIYENYMIDGMLFDDYFYPGNAMPGYQGNGRDEDSEDYQTWVDSKTTLSLYDWRRENVNSFVRELYADIQAKRPDMRFGIGPAGVSYESAASHKLPKPNVTTTDWQYDKIFCDPLAWLADGSIDFISPQIYWHRGHSTAPYEPLCEWWSMVADHFGRHNYVSMASYKIKDDLFSGGVASKGWAEIQAQVELTRNHTLNNAPGAIYYNTKSINGPLYDGLGEHLKSTVYTGRVLVPPVTWKQRVNYAAPANVVVNGDKLTWTATKGAEKAIIRYTVYAVPTLVEFEQAMRADGDGLDARYLVDVTYSPSFTLPADKVSGYWYAVCVYDGLGFESEPSLVNYSAERAESVTLLSPATGATGSWDTEFEWSAVKDATYTLQIATDGEFRNLFAEQTKLEATKATQTLAEAADGQQLYWRVVSTVPGKLSGYSQTRELTAPVRQPAVAATLLSPADGAECDGVDVEFSWAAADEPTAADYALSYRLEIADAEGSFDNPLLTRTVKAPATSCSVALSSIGTGTFRWRVVTSSQVTKETSSQAFAFKVSRIDVGNFEQGYTIKNDPAKYNSVSGVGITNLWYRAVGSPYNNMTFESNGALNRGMAATAECVYVGGRTGASSTADSYLDVYSAVSGERMRRIMLGDEARVGYLPCNDVIKDSEGHICVTNMSLNISTTPIVVNLVNTEDGSLTTVAKLTSSLGGRVDHAGIYGDVTSGTFYVFAAVASTGRVMRWEVNTATGVAKATSRTYKNFYPVGMSHFSVAPRVRPVDENMFYVDGSATGWTLYDIRRDGVAGSFSNAPSCAPVNPNDNGGALFSVGGKEMCAYSHTPASLGTKFAVATCGDTDFSGMTMNWLIPSAGMGKVESSACTTPVDAVNISPSRANLFIYSPGNGLAAYKIEDLTGGVDDIAVDNAGADSRLNVRVSGLTVYVNGATTGLSAYTLSGALVAKSATGTEIVMPAAGTYVVRAGDRAAVVSVR